MLTYNSKRPPLPLPEYGRYIQKMVDHCLTIEDRDERTRCAFAIADTIAKLFPKIKEQPDFEQKIWDHIAIMSGFRLDVDAPVIPATPESLESSPERVPYPGRYIRLRHYGKDIELMIQQAVEMPEGDDRDEMIYLIANQMKKMLTAENPDRADDARVFADLAEYSHGAIRVQPGEMILSDFRIILPPSGKKKKKKY